MTDNKLKHSELLEKLQDLTETKAFLAKDFLLWLWYFIESEQNPKSLLLNGRDHLIKFWIEDRMILESDDAKAHIHTLRGGEPSRSIEAESALISGKSVQELKLGFHIEPYGEFFCILNVKDLAPRSIQLPSVTLENDGIQVTSQLAYRLKMIDFLVDTLDGIFREFLNLRVSEKSWTVAWKQIQDWIDHRGHGEDRLH